MKALSVTPGFGGPKTDQIAMPNNRAEAINRTLKLLRIGPP